LKNTALATALLTAFATVVTAYGDIEQGSDWDGSLTVPVHRIPLFDEEEQEILPAYGGRMPFSTRYTCGPCHDYSTVAGGVHFNSSKESASAGRRGEPWVWVDEPTGTQLPLSYRDWAGTWNPRELGITEWRFTQLFGRHMPGGDAGEPADTLADPRSRWDVSGTVEINCLGCHGASPGQDHGEWGKQMARENFRWAATAASGLGVVTGVASRLPDTWTVHDGTNPDDTDYAVPPTVHYDQGLFDHKGRALFEITDEPPDRNCLYCHSVSQVGTEKWELDNDVHSASGMKCADCHRNGLDHNMVLGYEGEAHERGDLTVAEFSCEGCHLGVPDAVLGGRLGASRPEHKGISPAHLERMACTVCHSGAWSATMPLRVRTSRSNRLGIYGVAQWYTDAPYIVEPVYVRESDGKLTPHRMMWPAFWGRLEGETVTPLSPDEAAPFVEGILDAEQQVGRMLASFAEGLAALAMLYPDQDLAGEPVFVTAGKVYRLNVDGGLDVSHYTTTEATATGHWAQLGDGELRPLVPDFDPEAGDVEILVEHAIISIIEWLAPEEDPRGEPVFVRGTKVYGRNIQGYLSVLDLPEGESDAPMWGWRKDDAISPLVPEFVMRSVAETVGIEESFTEEQAVLVLKALSDDEQGAAAGEFVYVSGGKMFRLDEAGELAASDHPAAEPYLWPIAHDVRPAERSLGARACTDCHGPDAPFFFGEVSAFGPLKTDHVAVRTMHEIQEADLALLNAWERSVRLRPVYVVGGWAAAVLLAMALARYGFSGLERAVRALAARKPKRVD